MNDGIHSSKWIFVAGVSLLVILLLFYLALTYTDAPTEAKATVLTAAIGTVTVLIGYIGKALSN